MRDEEYIEVLLDYYEHPRNRGRIEGAELHASGRNPGCGDVISIYAHLDDQGRLAEVSFEGEGCTISQAAASLLTEVVIGKTVLDVEGMSSDDLVEVFGREVLAVRPRCATLGLTILKSAARDYRSR